ncbi:MAG: hypothetical protein P8H59_09400 [Flavobacteriales bacterium]|nr:hypothetical protein [Flavobacteriales bacterium]MDG1781155.1 hypothetical protein [Flavobacteriales bacterium]
MKSVRVLVVLIAFIAPFDGSSQEKELQKFVKKFMNEMADWDDISSFIHPEIGGYDTLITDRIMIQDYYLESYTDTTFARGQ